MNASVEPERLCIGGMQCYEGPGGVDPGVESMTNDAMANDPRAHNLTI